MRLTPQWFVVNDNLVIPDNFVILNTVTGVVVLIFILITNYKTPQFGFCYKPIHNYEYIKSTIQKGINGMIDIASGNHKTYNLDYYLDFIFNHINDNWLKIFILLIPLIFFNIIFHPARILKPTNSGISKERMSIPFILNGNKANLLAQTIPILENNMPQALIGTEKKEQKRDDRHPVNAQYVNISIDYNSYTVTYWACFDLYNRLPTSPLHSIIKDFAIQDYLNINGVDYYVTMIGKGYTRTDGGGTVIAPFPIDMNIYQGFQATHRFLSGTRRRTLPMVILSGNAMIKKNRDTIYYYNINNQNN